MANSVRPFLMFEGKAEEAMNFYVSLFADAVISDVTRWGPGQPGSEGSFMLGTFTVAGQSVRCFNSPVHHEFAFTPSFSFFVECESEDEIKRLNDALSDGGSVLMPLDKYDFARQFTWVADRYGVSWQLNLA